MLCPYWVSEELTVSLLGKEVQELESMLYVGYE
jgi:hypothetical protein